MVQVPPVAEENTPLSAVLAAGTKFSGKWGFIILVTIFSNAFNRCSNFYGLTKQIELASIMIIMSQILKTKRVIFQSLNHISSILGENLYYLRIGFSPLDSISNSIGPNFSLLIQGSIRRTILMPITTNIDCGIFFSRNAI
jgi:hypothetical protein